MADMEQALESVRISPADSQLNGIHLKDTAEADSTMPNEDPEMQTILDRVKEMEEETENMTRLQKEMEKDTSMRSPGGIPTLTLEEKIEADSRSVYVGNVDYGSTAEELEHHFHACGSINRVTILCDKYSGHPKGFAYIEFSDKNSVPTAMSLDDSVFRGRQIKVMQKRTNRPGISTTNRPPRVGRFRRPFRGTVIYRSPRRSFRYA